VVNYLDTTDDGQRDREEERVNKCLDWLENGYVLDERIVPEQSKDES
jgi:hypothetical protein